MIRQLILKFSVPHSVWSSYKKVISEAEKHLPMQLLDVISQYFLVVLFAAFLCICVFYGYICLCFFLLVY